MILHYINYFHPNLKISSRHKVMCGRECCISNKIIHSSLLSWRDRYFKKSRIKSKMLKTEGLSKNKITYIKHIKILSYQMGVIFTPKHMIRKRKKLVHIHIQIMYYHTRNVSCDVVPNVPVLIFLTNKNMINITTLVHQSIFTFII